VARLHHGTPTRLGRPMTSVVTVKLELRTLGHMLGVEVDSARPVRKGAFFSTGSGAHPSHIASQMIAGRACAT
jgi:hypothetical protein